MGISCCQEKNRRKMNKVVLPAPPESDDPSINKNIIPNQISEPFNTNNPNDETPYNRDFNIREQRLTEREQNLNNRETNMNEREKSMNIREENINQKMDELLKRKEENINKINNENKQSNNVKKPEKKEEFNNKSNDNSNDDIKRTENIYDHIFEEFPKENPNKNKGKNLIKSKHIQDFKEDISYKEYEIIQRMRKEELENSKEFYDMVLDFSNFEQLKKEGWKINFSQEGEQKYNKSKNKKNIIVGIIGNKNRGKSFLLGKIIGKKEFTNKSGFLITTHGISANFPLIDENDKINIITLDTAGKDNPLLDASNMKESVKSLTEKNEEIKNIARDQRVSEIVLSDYIIQESDVLITVIEQLSFAEQEMLKNLINQLKSKRVDANSVHAKKLLVIHNLMNFRNVRIINNFIEKTLLNSLTFDLRNGKQPMSIFKENKNIDDSGKYIYVQKTGELDKLQIIHIIVGNDYIEEIKKEFNEPAIRYIRKAIKIATLRKIDLIENFKDFIIKNSQKYINGNGFNDKSLLVKKKGSKEGTPEAIICKENNDFKLKSVFVDSRGFNNFLSTIEPKYSSRIYQEKSNEKEYYLEVIFEMFGKIVKNANKDDHKDHKDDNEYYKDCIKSTVSIVRNQHVITIEGRVRDSRDINLESVQGNLKYSEFYFQIIFDKYIKKQLDKNQEIEYSIAKIKNEDRKIKANPKIGTYIIRYPIKYLKMSG